jgi:indoleamine 2,3-dioxygenase
VTGLFQSLGKVLSARRALAFLAHLYVHSLPEGRERLVPSSIAVPFVIISHKLDIPPIILFADTEFWNFSIPPGQPLETDVEMHILSNFSNTPDEAFFYITGLLIELEGVSALHLMHDAIRALRHPDGAADLCAMAALLHQLAARIHRMAAILDGVRAGCDANIYYDDVRLWFNGSPGDPAGAWRFAIEGVADADADALGRALEESKWVRDVRDGVAEMTEMAGASAAQSSTVQALDAFLGIDRHTHETTAVDVKPGRGNFLELMRQYMPRTHRTFIERLAIEGSVLREWVDADADVDVKAAYNASGEHYGSLLRTQLNPPNPSGGATPLQNGPHQDCDALHRQSQAARRRVSRRRRPESIVRRRVVVGVSWHGGYRGYPFFEGHSQPNGECYIVEH